MAFTEEQEQALLELLKKMTEPKPEEPNTEPEEPNTEPEEPNTEIEKIKAENEHLKAQQEVYNKFLAAYGLNKDITDEKAKKDNIEKVKQYIMNL